MKSEEITDIRTAVRHRSYGDACGAAHALELVGERWALLVMRELMFGPKRFGDLRGSLPGISANVLTQRLAGLEEAGIVVRRRLPPPASAQVYELTDWGYESEPIFQALGRWAVRSPLHDPTLPFSAASLMLSMRTMLDPTRVKDLDARVGFRLGPESFLATLRAGQIAIARADVTGAGLVVTSTPPVVAGWLYGGQPLEELATAGLLRIEGDRALAERFETLFPLPAKTARPS